jgi:DnaJ-class molecular chaperone
MARSETEPASAAEAAPCSCCGGSGVLRTEAAGYRTCLECLGQGRTPRFEAVFALPAVLREPCEREPQAISASTSGAR